MDRQGLVQQDDSYGEVVMAASYFERSNVGVGKRDKREVSGPVRDKFGD